MVYVLALVVVGALFVAAWATLRALDRRKRAQDLDLATRQHVLMDRVADEPTVGDPHQVHLPACDSCGDILADMEALEDHIREKH